MSFKSPLMSALIVLLCVFFNAQLQTESGSSGGDPNGVIGAVQQKTLAMLTTRGNEPILVNSASVITGATILSGATIGTSEGAGATVKLGSLATLSITPKSTLTLDFEQAGDVKVTIKQGCATLRTMKGRSGEILSPQGSAGKTGPTTDGPLSVCFPTNTGTDTANLIEAKRSGSGDFLSVARAAIGALMTGRIAAGMDSDLAERGRNPGPSAP
jgi:hypothetical protein